MPPTRGRVIRPSGPTTFGPANSGLPGKSRLIWSPGPIVYSSPAAGSKFCRTLVGFRLSLGSLWSGFPREILLSVQSLGA